MRTYKPVATARRAADRKKGVQRRPVVYLVAEDVVPEAEEDFIRAEKAARPVVMARPRPRRSR